MSRTRQHPDDRKQAILDAAIHVALMEGFAQLSKPIVAERAQCSTALINRYFGTMDALATAVMEHAVAEGMASLVAQGLVARHPAAMAAPEALREAAARAII